jgi:hypothetical protein
MASSPPLSPRLHPSAAGAHHTRAPSFSATLNVVDLLISQQPNGSKPPVREWTKIPISELVQGQQLNFLDGDTPVEEACQVMSPRFFSCDVDLLCGGGLDSYRSQVDITFTSVVA